LKPARALLIRRSQQKLQRPDHDESSAYAAFLSGTCDRHDDSSS